MMTNFPMAMWKSGTVATPYSLSLNGSTQFVTTVDAASQHIADNLTVLIWIKAGTTQPGAPGCMIGKAESHSGATHWSWSISTPNGSGTTGCFEVLCSQDGTFSQINWVASTSNVLDSTWRLIGFKFVAGTITLFNQGAVQGQSTVSNTGITTLHNNSGFGISVGGRLTNSSIFWPFSGKLFRPMVWNVALSTAAVTALYNAGHAVDPTVSHGSYTSQANLIFGPLQNTPPDSNTGTVADASGSANTGTCVGTPTFSADTPI